MTGSRVKRISAVLLTVCLLMISVIVTSHQVVAEEESTSTVTIKVDPAYEGVPMSMVEIGDYSSGSITLQDAFEALEPKITDAKTSDELSAAAEAAADHVRSSDIEGEIAWIAADGNAVFENVARNKAYLILQLMGQEIVYIQPIVVTVPLLVDGELVDNPVITAKFVQNSESGAKGALILTKRDDEEQTLAGAEFALWQKVYYSDVTRLPSGIETGTDSTGMYYWKAIGDRMVTDQNGQIVVEELPFAAFRVVETKAPEGYSLDPEPIMFDVRIHGTVKLQNGIYVPDKGEPVELTVRNVPVHKVESSTPSTESSDETSEYSGSSEPSFGRESSTPPKPEEPDKHTEITGDDLVRYLVIGSVVCISLVVIILLMVVGSRRRKDDTEN